MAIAVAPVLAVEAVGLLLVALGSCTTGLLMSLLGDAVRPSQVGAVYSAALMLSIISRSIMGPVVNALLVGGLKLGWVWMGLPFGFVAVLLLGVALATGFIRKEKKEGFAKD
jgi:MFS family permease